MEKRVILAFVLSFVVLYASRGLYSPPTAPEAQSATEVPSQPSVASVPAPVKLPAIQPEAPVAGQVHEVRAEKPEELVFETPLYIATVSNVGGVLKSFKLKEYLDAEGKALELINAEAGEKVGWPLAFASGDAEVDELLRSAPYAAQRQPDKLVLEFASNGLHARKVLQFESENYAFTLEASLIKNGKNLNSAVVWQGNFGDQSIPQDPVHRNAVYQTDGAFERKALQSLTDQPLAVTSLRAGVEDQYFIAMFLSENPIAVKISKKDYSVSDKEPIPSAHLSTAIPPQEMVRLYVGPKQQDWLSRADPQLSTVVDYGFFEFIARPLVAALLWIHSYIGNFGWSIILLTVMINLVLFPLRLKQQLSMLKMQKIQPQMRRLQDQYKKLKATDPKRTEVQSEMMGLYKQHGVNPMGGCLPLVLQMPFFFAFYSALAYSIELRRAPWILWIKDLSLHDPTFVLPILMAVAMIVQQKLTPTTNLDPVQARMMMIMPIIMSFMFLWVSSGLALYWLTGSVVGIGQQVFMNKYWSPRAEAKLKPRSS